MAAVVRKQKVSPNELAKRWGVSPRKVKSFIQSGELRAVDFSTRRAGRPRWLIDLEDVAKFEAARQAQPPAPPQQRRKPGRPVADGAPNNWY